MLYELILLVHVLAGMVWVGGGIVLHVTVRVANATGGPEAADRTLAGLAWADDWLAIPAPLLVLGSGVFLVVDAGWRWSQLWLYLSLGLVVAYEILALTAGGRLYRRLEAARADGRITGSGEGNVIADFLAFGSLLVMILLAVVVLMVLKPGL